jgi:hypothetical protein
MSAENLAPSLSASKMFHILQLEIIENMRVWAELNVDKPRSGPKIKGKGKVVPILN